MSDSDGLSISSGLLNSLSIDKAVEKEPKSNELGQSAFLELMITQMNNQNPLDPQDNTEFVAQLAQFSTVEGIEKLNNSFDSMALNLQSSQALQASALVGRTVHVNGTTAKLAQGGQISGTIELPATTDNLMLNIYDQNGALVRQEFLGNQPAGDVAFVWDGRNSDGEFLPPGNYSFQPIANIDGESSILTTALSANVNSVTINKVGNLTLNLDGLGSIDIGDVKEIL
jgi:flagellar basal-body rod modification protein FlgD